MKNIISLVEHSNLTVKTIKLDLTSTGNHRGEPRPIDTFAYFLSNQFSAYLAAITKCNE